MTRNTIEIMIHEQVHVSMTETSWSNVVIPDDASDYWRTTLQKQTGQDH